MAVRCLHFKNRRTMKKAQIIIDVPLNQRLSQLYLRLTQLDSRHSQFGQRLSQLDPKPSQPDLRPSS